MKLTAFQTGAISQLVSNEVHYQETYQEVYDHVITTLEAKDSIPDLQKAYADILEQDFGGHGGIEKLEGRQRFMLRQDMKQKRWQYFTWFFKLPGIIIPIVYLGICYYGFGFNEKWFALKLIFGTIVLIFLPSVYIFVGNVIIAYKQHPSKQSVKSISSNVLGRNARRFIIWGFLYNAFFGLLHLGHIDEFFKFNRATSLILNHVLLCVVFLLVSIYNVAIFKVYRIEFKKRLAI